MNENWERLCALLDDDVLLIPAVAQAASDPAAYYAAHKQQLLQRGIESGEEVDPWTALIDGLDDAGALAYLDWKDSGMELVDALSEVPRVKSSGVDLTAVSDVDELEAAVAAANAVLAPHNLRVIYLDEDSDAYPLVAVPTANVEAIVELASELEHEARVFSEVS